MIYKHCMTMVGTLLLIIRVKYVIFSNSVYDIVVVIEDNEYKVSSFGELISLQIKGKTLLEIMSEAEVQYG